jgi:hypothetical protein
VQFERLKRVLWHVFWLVRVDGWSPSSVSRILREIGWQVNSSASHWAVGG